MTVVPAARPVPAAASPSSTTRPVQEDGCRTGRGPARGLLHSPPFLRAVRGARYAVECGMPRPQNAPPHRQVRPFVTVRVVPCPDGRSGEGAGRQRHQRPKHSKKSLIVLTVSAVSIVRMPAQPGHVRKDGASGSGSGTGRLRRAFREPWTTARPTLPGPDGLAGAMVEVMPRDSPGKPGGGDRVSGPPAPF